MKMTFRGFDTPSPPHYPMDRKTKKPLMEKHRRERMNKSLGHLKDKLIKHYPTETSKLEKADILEKTVYHVDKLENDLQFIQQHFNNILRQHEAKFLEFLSMSSTGLSKEQRQKVLDQFQSFFRKPAPPPPMPTPPISFPPLMSGIFKPLPIPPVPPMFLPNLPLPFPLTPMSSMIPPTVPTSTPSTASPVIKDKAKDDVLPNLTKVDEEEVDVDGEWSSSEKPNTSDDSGVSSSPDISKPDISKPALKRKREYLWRPF